jgi:hypothetical protein
MPSDPKSIDDVMKEFDRLHNVPINITDSVTHEEFVAGVREGRVGIKVIKGEPITLVTGVRKTIFNVMAMLYLIAPALLVPLWAYHERSWWLLFGIGTSWAATAVTANLASVIFGGKTAGSTLLLGCIVLWLSAGIHSPFTFFAVCALWGCVLFQIAESCQNEYALQCLGESSELFARAIEGQSIIVIRRRDAHEP